MNKREYQMPYEYFEDDMTRVLMKSQPKMADPDFCYKALMWRVPGDKEYLLNQKNRGLFRKNGKFKPPYYSIDHLEDAYQGQPAFVFCPGPSMDMVDLDLFKGKLTIAVNSAGFKFRSLLWTMFESNYMLWVVKQNIPKNHTYVMTARCAIRWRDMFKNTPITRAVFVPRFEELRIMPHRTPAVGTMGALTTAWWLGAKTVYVIGMDLSRPKKQAYTKGVPYSSFGATNPFTEQIRALHQYKLPDFQVVNGSPFSKTLVPFETASYEEIQEIAANTPSVQDPCEMINHSPQLNS